MMSKRGLWLPALALIAGLPLPSWAVAPHMSSQVSPRPVVAGLGVVTQDGLGINLQTRYGERSERQSGARKADNPDNDKAETWAALLLLDRHVAKNLAAIMAIPYISNHVSYGDTRQMSRGLGDISLYGKYSFYRDRPFDATSELAALAGVKFPSGSTSVSDATAGRLSATQQPGSGSTDFIVGGTAVRGFTAVTAYGDVSYKINGNRAYKFGNFFALNVGANYAVAALRDLGLVGEFNCEFAERDKSAMPGSGVLADGAVRDTGHERVYFSPGLQWRAMSGTLNFGVQVPIYQNLRGTQLAAGINYNFGVSTRFSGW